MPAPRTSARRRVGRAAACLVTLAAVLGVVRLALPADGPPAGVDRQLAFLRAALDDGAGERAQRQFPEGYFFLHALYGLSRVELGLREPADQRAEALREARWALGRLDAPAGRAPFDPGLTPAHGVFYRGWTNWLRGGVLSLQPAGSRDLAEVRRFADDSAALAAAFGAAPSPFLAAYPGQAWPVDSTVAVASLRLHDALLPPRFAGTVARWLAGVRQRLDPATGLLPHRVDVATGAVLDGARGSSQAMIQRFLADIDPGFAAGQYRTFRDRYVAVPLGLGPAVREYPHGVDGPGDVDSGPLLLGVSLSATVVTVGAARVHGDARLAGALARYGEVAGLPVDTPRTKRYALGLVPIGDAFLAWSKTARPWVAPTPAPPPATLPAWWWAPLLGLLAAAGLAPWLPALARRARRSRVDGQDQSNVMPRRSWRAALWGAK
ncbi:hypothetical protein [Spirilliplanes yamanashiensis]|uniref:Uncharacterized protein n=1 Tax=Spirilliplanes yamanashiensis TaxID=42233 RepID=A0A8J3YBL4_9ACTN|nr:hypothetical protein [Spirilliplanes yamanashiensis]MDP9818159.1 hypothetical protein [Spirilliplanes yamanashiensis]GIJ04970.1 hypothetical protein Sya03_43220 [Spirilliplanes yamanashiensis]